MTEIRGQPLVGAGAAHIAQMGEKLPICIEFGNDAEVFHERFGLDRMYQHGLYFAVQRTSADELVGEGNRSHLAHHP